MKYIFFCGILFLMLASCSKDSSPGNTTPPAVAPGAPGNLILTVTSSTKIKLAWTDNSGNENGFKIERKTASTDYTLIATSAKNITEYIDSNLLETTAYTYKIYSFNDVGNSTSITGTATTDTFLENVVIAVQTWALKNLDVATYRNGDPIPEITDATAWLNATTGAWCYYNNDPANGAVYGKLYNWYAVNDPRGLAPQGWHIPSNGEWTILTNYLGGELAAGAKMKSLTLWDAPNAGATNSSGFTALPGGGGGDVFENINRVGYWWSATLTTSPSPIKAWGLYMENVGETASPGQYELNLALSVRCVKN